MGRKRRSQREKRGGDGREGGREGREIGTNDSLKLLLRGLSELTGGSLRGEEDVVG